MFLNKQLEFLQKVAIKSGLRLKTQDIVLYRSWFVVLSRRRSIWPYIRRDSSLRCAPFRMTAVI